MSRLETIAPAAKKTFYVMGRHTVDGITVNYNQELKAVNIPAAITEYKKYSNKIYGATGTHVIKVFECVWN